MGYCSIRKSHALTLTSAPLQSTIVRIMSTKIEKPFTIAGALFGKTRLEVLGLLCSHPERSFYLREIVRSLSAAQGAVQRELQNLCNADIIERSRIGNQVHYKANRRCPIYEELRAIMLKTVGVADVLRRALAPLNEQIEFAFIYGSMAAGDSDAGSDVDVMVAGDVSFGRIVDQLQGAQQKIGREINPRVYNPGEFQEKIKAGNPFLKRVMEAPKVFIIGDEDDFEAVAQ